MITKIITLFFIIFFILFIFRLLKYKSHSSNSKSEVEEEKIIDLEKDSKTDEYKPKE